MEVVIDYVYYVDFVVVFECVIGFKVKFVDVSFEEYWIIGFMVVRVVVFVGYIVDINELGMLSVKDNFIGFWNLWRDLGNNKGVVK